MLEHPVRRASLPAPVCGQGVAVHRGGGDGDDGIHDQGEYYVYALWVLGVSDGTALEQLLLFAGAQVRLAEGADVVCVDSW